MKTGHTATSRHYTLDFEWDAKSPDGGAKGHYHLNDYPADRVRFELAKAEPGRPYHWELMSTQNDVLLPTQVIDMLLEASVFVSTNFML